MASVQLRTLIDNVISDTSRDMKEQADGVDASFQKRVVEVENAKSSLEDSLRKVSIRRRNFRGYEVYRCPHFLDWGKNLLLSAISRGDLRR